MNNPKLRPLGFEGVSTVNNLKLRPLGFEGVSTVNNPKPSPLGSCIGTNYRRTSLTGFALPKPHKTPVPQGYS